MFDTTICTGASYLGYTISENYVQHYTTVYGCDSTTTIKLSIVQKMATLNLSSQRLCQGDSILLNPGNYESYLWQDGSMTKTYTVKQTGLYAVTVADKCATAYAQINIDEGICDIYFPSAFLLTKMARTKHSKY